MTGPEPEPPFERLGGYALVRRVGAGGMGEVYLARDLRLERDVAIKLLSPQFSSDPASVARFRQEALTIAALNHPNIATIYGFENTPGGGLALVLEYVVGESLATRLQRGALPVTEALTVCAQVAEALEVAHDRGIVHRDLKPGNVMLAPRGLVKVLDFGLAIRSQGLVGVTRQEDAGPGTVANAGAVPSGGTLGWMGTPGYMSPEQLLMGTQDRRGDIFSFGVLLYECLSGRRAFDGRDEWEMMARVLNESPDPAFLPERLSPRIRRLLERCLDKQMETRPADLRHARVEIEEVLGVRRAAALRAGETSEVAHNLPQPATSFVGREEELERCRYELTRTRLLTLLGMGGSGKTRLALRLAEATLEEHPDGVWFADMSGLDDPARVVETVAAAMGIQPESGRPLERTLVEHLEKRRLLLLLDNCEGVLAGCRELAGHLLSACGEVRVLATSREALGVQGETIHAVLPLAVPSGAPGEDPGATESVRLFLRRAEAANPGLAFSDEQLVVVGEVCRRLDGIPLAIELAAARTRVLGVEQILARLGDRFRLLTAAGPAGDRRHQTLRAVIEWSIDQLTEEERWTLRALSVFAGSWSLESAVAVCGPSQDDFGVLDTLQRLADKSLVVPSRAASGDARYRYLESVRELASGQLTAAGDAEAVRDRHLERFRAVAEGFESRFAGAGQREALLDLDLEHADVLAAQTWSEGRTGGGDAGLRIAAAMHRYWSARGLYRLGRRMLGRALAAAGDAADGAVWATACVRAAGFALYENDHPAARPLLEGSLAVYRRIGDHRGIARSLHGLGTVAFYEEDYVSARTWILEVVALHRSAGDRRGLGTSLHNLGEVSLALGDPEAARHHYEEALDLFRESGDELRAAHALAGLGTSHTRRGDFPAAGAALARGLRLATGLEAPREIAVGLEGAAELAMTVGHPALAPRWLGAADALRERHGLARLSAEREEFERAMASLRSRLGAEAADSASEAGRADALPESVKSALAWLATVGATTGGTDGPAPGDRGPRGDGG